MSLKDQIDISRLPQHVAVIMDGNGRWAKTRGNARVFGHRNAIKAVRDTTEGAAELGIDFLTLFAFSTENWERPPREVNALMTLLVDTIRKETATLTENNVRLHAIGQLDRLPGNCRKRLEEAIELTAGNERMVLTLALSYGARSDMVQAVQQLAAQAATGDLDPASIDAQTISQHLSTRSLPDPELLIRTSGEFRISNFLLWEIAYAEIFITPKLWPDFRRDDLYAALVDYQKRERRFGKISDQIQSNP
jgi:undecaprenyl diphosphate synthase